MESRQQTLRISGLPPATCTEDIENFFNERINSKGRQIIEAVGPVCGSDSSDITKHTTVTFSSNSLAEKALGLEYARKRFLAVRGGDNHIRLDHEFKDMTTLFSSDNPESAEPDIDIVALHGLTGHAWNTFAVPEVVNKQANRTRENNWLRDNLPQLLKHHPQHNLHARVMTFGYNADVWMTKSVADLDVPVNNLILYLNVERAKAPYRPLFFIGHSLGGIVIKQVIVNMANEAIARTLNEDSPSQGKYIFPVKGCLFFGVPHRGTDVADTASKFLNALSKVFNVNRNNISDLRAKSQRLANVSSEFRRVQFELDIQVMSFYETVEYNRTLGLIVEKDSAIFDYPGKPAPFGVNSNHKDMAKFLTDDHHALQPAVHFLAEVASKAVALQRARFRAFAPPPLPAPTNGQGQDVEDSFSILETYDTVFLIDDSPSMRGEKWELVQKILDYSIRIAIRYDTDGIDIHFLNNFKANQNNVKHPEIGVQIHHDVDLRGSTPLLDRLTRHLKGYMQEYKKSGWSLDHKRYNLIVLTDGEPNPEHEDESDVSDPQDAKKNKPAFRLMRKAIVNIARTLDSDDVDADRKQVGIQFCQIGHDYDATVFFQYLDDRLKSKHYLKRDMVDTIRCQSELDLTQDFFQKLLLGAIDKREDNKKIEDRTTKEPEHQHHPPRRSHTVLSEGDTLVGSSSTRWNSFPAN